MRKHIDKYEFPIENIKQSSFFFLCLSMRAEKNITVMVGWQWIAGTYYHVIHSTLNDMLYYTPLYLFCCCCCCCCWLFSYFATSSSPNIPLLIRYTFFLLNSCVDWKSRNCISVFTFLFFILNVDVTPTIYNTFLMFVSAHKAHQESNRCDVGVVTKKK